VYTKYLIFYLQALIVLLEVPYLKLNIKKYALCNKVLLKINKLQYLILLVSIDMSVNMFNSLYYFLFFFNWPRTNGY